VQGLLMVNLSDDPLPLDDAIETANGIFGSYDWANAKVIHQISITFDANWKLALENQVECMHCGPAHPEFSFLHGQGLPNEAKLQAELNARSAELGLKFLVTDKWVLKATPGQEMTFSDRMPMRPGVESATESGKTVAPLMGSISIKDGGFSQLYIGPHNHFLTYSDYGASFCYVPRNEKQTTLNVMWMVHPDAVEGRDYKREDVTWLWEVTAAADKHIVEENQRGVGSRFYKPGPYALPIEYKTARLTEWYLSAMKAAADKILAASAK
jgi:phenylpropionate dioxygenase-like ring-hydroxylating dioxygenase large terminal subunit